MVQIVCPECESRVRAGTGTVILVACKQHRWNATVTLADLYGKERAC